MLSKVDVLNSGYVRVRDHMGDDLTPVNAARVSYDKQAEWDITHHPAPAMPNIWDIRDDTPLPLPYDTCTMKQKDERLLAFLLREGHTSPFRHAVISYEVYAPLMVMRQWGKYRVGSVWSFEDSDDPLETINESSRRYVTEEPEFYIPSEWRSKPENSKQGSGEPVNNHLATSCESTLSQSVEQCRHLYQMALDAGICAEQARLFLPAYALYVRAIWTVSLQGVLHFLDQRLEHDAQWEIQQYAQAVKAVTEPLFPKIFELYTKESYG